MAIPRADRPRIHRRHEGPCATALTRCAVFMTAALTGDRVPGERRRRPRRVLVNPVVRMRDTIDALAAHHGAPYRWTAPADAFAARTDFVARAAEFAGTAVLAVTGEDDLRAAFIEPVAALVPELRRHGVTAEWRTIPGMAHALADEPGTEPAPQRPTAAEVDRLAVAWFSRYL
jgi:hypothetical protein